MKVDDFVPQEAWWTVPPEGFEAKLEINLRIKAQEGTPLVICYDLFLVSRSCTSSTLDQSLSMKSGY